MDFPEFSMSNASSLTKRTKDKFWLAVNSHQLKSLRIGGRVIVEIMDAVSNTPLYTGLGQITDKDENTKLFDKKVEELKKYTSPMTKGIREKKFTIRENQSSNDNYQSVDLTIERQIADAADLIKLNSITILLKPLSTEIIKDGFKNISNIDTCRESCELTFIPLENRVLGGTCQSHTIQSRKDAQKHKSVDIHWL